MRQQVRDPQAEFTVNVWQPLFGSDLTSLEAAPASTSSTPGTASFPDMSASSSSEDSATSSSEERTGFRSLNLNLTPSQPNLIYL